MPSDSITELDDLLQSAALDPSRWPAALDSIVRMSGARGAFILPLKGRTRDAPCTESASEQLDRYFADDWARRDHRYKGVDKMLRTGTMVDQDFTTPEEMERSAYYREFLEPVGLRWFAGLGFRAASETWCLALQRSIGQPFFSPDEERALLRFQGPLSRAGALALQVGRVRIDGRADAIDALGGPAFLLDRFGRVIRSTAAAEALIGKRLALADGYLASRVPAEALALKRLVQAALWTETRPESDALSPVFLRSPGARPIMIQAQPLRSHAQEFFGSATILLLVTDLNAVLRPADAALRQAFGLTQPEGRLAGALASTYDLRTAAEAVGVGYETARTHFKMILAKTGTRNQGQFLALATRLTAPVPGAVLRPDRR